MLIEAYYERMNYQQLQEYEAYSLVNLISDMGGQLGLWLGISVITGVEFLSLLLMCCVYCITRPDLSLWLGISVITGVEFLSLLLMCCVYCITRPDLSKLDDLSDEE